MNVSETFIRRPIATSLLMAAIALFGVVSYRTLPISELPIVANATISVSAYMAKWVKTAAMPSTNPERPATAGAAQN
jgi:hydrophobic/amphiphilic exporter-1 (mainly G- bacteria), HAE1 family